MAKPTGVTGAERYGWQAELARTLVDGRWLVRPGLIHGHNATVSNLNSHAACYRVPHDITEVSPSVIVNRVEYLICRCEC